jgi:long-chain acyl-CoA synthetase
MDEATKSEGIEALIYASDSAYTRLGAERGNADGDAKVKACVEEIVGKVNKTEQPYARISKITMLDKPLEMTTTKKVKRNYNK